MGCLFHKSKRTKHTIENDTKKEYSWDKREAVNVDDFTIENLEDSEKWKLPGCVNGQQLVIQNCKNSTIYVLDHVNTITIDDCVGCKLILGPVKGSTFLRDCKDCICLVASGQFRIRDSRNLIIFLYCATQPIIESSSAILFGCYQLFYSGIKEHFKNAELSVFNNYWNSVHDFTPVDGECNWGILPENTTPFQYISTGGDQFCLGISLSLIDSVVPYTTYTKISDEPDYCFVIYFFNNGEEENFARSLIDKIYTERVDCRLIWSKQIQLEPQEALNMLLSDTNLENVKKGPVIGLLFSGPNVDGFCKQNELACSADSMMYISDDKSILRKQINVFLNISNMHISF
ncbi:protein XRP2-like [Lycorma delicatula]|uniref:protein XRP2-like n=1 Tax=Lycorma delicatula TaxID=130591 RepID=UPI003F51A97B